MGNRPINANDPTGHKPCWANARHYSCIDGDNSPDNSDDDYVGPIPQAVINQLISQGADPDFLASVTIHNKQDDEWKKFCGSGGAIARTWDSTIYFCDSSYYDPSKPNHVLLHELIHVTQFQKYPAEIREELTRNAYLNMRDEAIKWWNSNWLGQAIGILNWTEFNPYKDSWVELQARNCEIAFKNDTSIQLNSPPCNLAPFE